MSLASALNVAIIGAGPGGLTAARILQRHGFQRVSVFEAEPTPLARDQGGSLDLREGTGQAALREAGLLADFIRLSRPEAQDVRVMGKDGVVYHDEITPPGFQYNPEIDRAQLRRLLLDSLQSDTVKWNHKLLRITSASGDEPGKSAASGPASETAETGALETLNSKNLKPGVISTAPPYHLHFADGRQVAADVVIGADGAWSRVRSMLTLVSPIYSGVSFVDLTVSSATVAQLDALALLGRGSCLALSDKKALMSQPLGGGHQRVYAALQVDETWHKTSPVALATSPEERRALLLALFHGWAPGLTDLIRHSDDSMVLRPIYALPPGQRWPSSPGMTLLGDAAHLMSPFAGEGVNTAMADAADLAAAISSCGSPQDVPAAIHEYEQLMFTRAEEAARESAYNLDVFFADTALQQVAAMFAAHHEEPRT